jgi:type I restriction enzyme M protein
MLSNKRYNLIVTDSLNYPKKTFSIQIRESMFEQTFYNLDNVLRQEAGCTTEPDYTEQSSWMLFLKYLDDLGQERAMQAELVGKSYEFIIDDAHRWSRLAAPKKKDGTFDHDTALTL